MNYKGKIALLICAVMGLVTAISHVSCLFFGPECFRAQLAPVELIESSEKGTLLAPVVTVFISFLFVLSSLFALSAIGLIKRLPFTYFALAFLAVLCVCRGLATIPLSFVFIEMVSVFGLVAGFIWFIVGLLYAYGFVQYHRNVYNKSE